MSSKEKNKKVTSQKSRMARSQFKTRGFRVGLHRVLAEADWDFVKKFEKWVQFVYLSDRHLDRRVKEMIIVGITATHGSPPDHIELHMRAAHAAGATKEQLIVIAELAGNWGGFLPRTNAAEAWRRIFAPHLPPVFQPLQDK